jgi:hypothetical protein
MADPANREAMLRRVQEIDAELARRGEGGGPAAPAAPPQAGGPEPGVVDNTLSTAGAVASDVGQGIWEAPGAVIRGIAGAVHETGNVVADMIEGAHKAREKALEGASPTQKALATDLSGAVVEPVAHATSWLAGKVRDAFAPRESVTGGFIEGASQFVTGMVGAGKFVALPKAVATKLGPKALVAAEGMLKGGVADFTVFNGTDERLSNLINEHTGFANAVTEYLAAKPTDGQAEGRFKNMLEGLALGPISEALFLAVKARKLFSAGKTKEAAPLAEQAKSVMDDLKVKQEIADAEKVDAGEPKPQPAEGATTPPADVPAPYGTDLAAPKPQRGPLEFKAGDVLPNVSPEDAARTQKAIEAKFAVAGEEMAKTGGHFNFRTITGDDDLKAALNATSAANERLINQTRGGEVRDHKTVLRDADEMADIFNTDRDGMLVVLGNDAKTLLHLDARLHTYKQFMLGAVDDAARLAETALAAKGTPDGAKAAAEAMHSATIASQVVAMVKGIETNVARTMTAQRLSKEARKGYNDYTEIAKRLEGGNYHSDDEALLKHLVTLKNNPKGFVKYMEKTFGEKASGAFNSWYLNALLSSPKTHAANFLSNTVSSLYMPLERGIAGMLTPNNVATSVKLARMVDEYHGLFSGLMDSWRAAGEALKLNQSVLDPGNGKHIDPTGKSIDGLSSRGLGLTNDYYDRSGNLVRTETTPVLSAMMDSVSNVVGMPSRLLTASDELFKQANYRAYLYGEAAQKARVNGLQSGSKEFDNFVATEMNRWFDKDGGALHSVAQQESRLATFTNDLEYGISKWIQGAANEHVALKLVVPFVRTPTNLFRFAWKRMPGIQFAEEGFRKDWAAGGERKARAQAQMMTGAAMYVTAVGLAATGNITGSLSANPEIRKAQEASGMREFAIKVGDKYIQYNRLDPMGTVLGIAADLHNLGDQIGDGEFDRAAYAAVTSLARNLSSKTYLQGMTNIFNSIGDVIAGRSTTGLDTWIYRTAGSVAVPGIVNAFKGDDSLREARSLVDTIRARVGSREVPPVRNVLGEVVEGPKAFGSNVFSPLGMGIDKHDKVYKELARQMSDNEHPLSRVMPTLEGTKVDLREMKLASGQNGYDRLQQMLWDSGVKDKLAKLFESDAYKNAHDAGLDSPMAPGSKLFLTNRVLEAHKEVARAKLYKENPDLLKLVMGEKVRMQTMGVNPGQPRIYQPPSFLESVFGNPDQRTPQAMLDASNAK